MATRPACLSFGATLIPKNIVNQAAQPPIHRIAMKPRMPVLFEIDVRHGDGEREHRQVGHSSERLADVGDLPGTDRGSRLPDALKARPFIRRHAQIIASRRGKCVSTS